MPKLNIKLKGKKCPDPETEACNEGHCPVDCVSKWGQWSVCNETCGDGTRTRKLNITTQAAFGGDECPVKLIEKDSCKVAACPVNCTFEWNESDWSSCSVTCGDGTQIRKARITENPEGLGEIRVLVDNSTKGTSGTIILRLYDEKGNVSCSTGEILPLQRASVISLITISIYFYRRN